MTDQSAGFATTDQYLTTVGKLTHNAAITDIVLFCAFNVLVGCSRGVGRAIYYAFDSISAKGRLVRRVAQATGDDQDLAIVEEIISAADAAHGPRNELAHASLTAPDDGDPGKPWQRLNPKAMKQPMRPVTIAYLKSLKDPSGAAVVSAHAAFRRFCEKRGVPPDLEIN
jgi:hypothetical protein